MKITKTQLRNIIKEELKKVLHEWDTRHQDLAMCDEKVPMHFSRNSPEYNKCLDYPEAYEPPASKKRTLDDIPDIKTSPTGGPHPDHPFYSGEK